MIEHDMGEQELVAVERAPGEYVADGSPTAMFGTWRIQTIVRLVGREDATTVFTVPVSAPVGAVSNSKVVSAPPYTLIVFTDPAQPLAGAPVDLFVVAIDAAGTPLTGKHVRASFSGPGAQPDIDAKEDAATLGPGRYQVAIAALEAGEWQIKIAVGSEASGTYSLDVSR
jgi:hypothetical protein